VGDKSLQQAVDYTDKRTCTKTPFAVFCDLDLFSNSVGLWFKTEKTICLSDNQLRTMRRRPCGAVPSRKRSLFNEGARFAVG